MNWKEISLMEELQNNAFPALQNVFYDGWSIRFGGGFTYRVNCANPMYPEYLDLEEKVEYVENLYRDSDLDLCIFKVHAGMDPDRAQRLDEMLEARGYTRDRDGNIFVCDLTVFEQKERHEVRVEPHMEEEWLGGFLHMNGTTGKQWSAASEMLKNIHYPILAASMWEDGRIVAAGLGVMERGYVGLYDIYVDSSCRGRGCRRWITSSLSGSSDCHTLRTK